MDQTCFFGVACTCTPCRLAQPIPTGGRLLVWTASLQLTVFHLMLTYMTLKWRLVWVLCKSQV